MAYISGLSPGISDQQLEAEKRLKKLVAERDLQIEVMKEIW
jgi:hypothetical protein